MSVYWIDGPEQPGRLAILAKPGGDGSLESAVQRWRDEQVDVVVSLLTDGDNARLGLTRESDVCRKHGLSFISFPIDDFGVPASLESALQLVSQLKDISERGKNIGFHCYASIGRAPLIASCLLMLFGMTAEAAFSSVAAARGCRIPDTPLQFEWGRQFELEVSQLAKR